ncbi:hypothetical protein L6452_17985 [Arctium lappa]|uniref:Uncharacterized protein n=1 Tax=Arctium lappa TaxID=4217 RepID=A0ACB9C4W4_ARCLA|nr:hypothetical protein L6452_17985 [Arctium lappa]
MKMTLTKDWGAVESISVGEIKLCLHQSLVRLEVGCISRDPKLQLVISDLEVVTRTSDKSSKRTKPRKPKSSGSKPGKGKLMAAANMARFLSLSMRGLVVKVSFSQQYQINQEKIVHRWGTIATVAYPLFNLDVLFFG